MKSSKSSPWLDQPELNEECPCGSHKQFGGCCGSNNDCPCKSHKSAGECCYAITDTEGLQPIKKR